MSNKSLVLNIQRKLFKSSAHKRKGFYEDFALALADSVSPVDRLRKLVVKSRMRSKPIAVLFESWLVRMRRVTFAESLQNSVPAYELMVLIGAERDGKLMEAMKYLSKSLAIKSKVDSAYVMAMLSPCLSFVIVVGMLITNALLVGPINLELLPINKWPASSRFMYELSNFFVGNWFFSISVTILILVLYFWSRNNWFGRLRVKIDNVKFLPWFSYRERQADAFAMSLALMLQSSTLGIKESLQQMMEYASPWMQWHLRNMYKRLALTPQEPARALNTGIFSESFMERIEDLSERTSFEEALKKMALENGDEAVERAQKKAVLTSFLAIGISASFMLFFAISQVDFGQALDANISINSNMSF